MGYFRGQLHAAVKEQAYQMQCFYAAALADLLGGVQEDLEAVAPNVERALRRIRGLRAR